MHLLPVAISLSKWHSLDIERQPIAWVLLLLILKVNLKVSTFYFYLSRIVDVVLLLLLLFSWVLVLHCTKLQYFFHHLTQLLQAPRSMFQGRTCEWSVKGQNHGILLDPSDHRTLGERESSHPSSIY